MSLGTTCPSCGTSFRVVQDQLKVSEGWVRCGQCQDVFNALESLFDLDPLAQQAQSVAPLPKTGPASLAHQPATYESHQRDPRAPAEFPPPWASAWGDDPYGLWADIAILGVVQRMRWIEPGEFIMGSPRKEDGRDFEAGPPHRVVLSDGIWLADTLCSQALWQTAMDGGNPSHFEGAHLPVERVTWDEVQDFLSVVNTLHPDTVHCELPTEAQWEYACRADTDTAYSWGDEADPSRANLPGSVSKTTPCKEYPPNPWGLYDMHGNLFEWCADSPRIYRDHTVIDPHGGTEGKVRVMRGGSWLDAAGLGRSAARLDEPHDRRAKDVGFRFVLMTR